MSGSRSGSDQRVNPFDRGCLANWAEVFCMRVPRSRCYFRAPFPLANPPSPKDLPDSFYLRPPWYYPDQQPHH